MAQTVNILVGTQIDDPGSGILHVQLDEQTGKLDLVGAVAEVARPTWLLAAPGDLVFAVSEVGNRDERIGELLSFRWDGAGRLTPIDGVPSGGGGPTHLDLSPGGDYLFAANYGGGQAVAVQIAATGRFGRLVPATAHSGSGPHPRQTKPHPHGVALDPSGRFLLVPDMGSDEVCVHGFDRRSGRFGSRIHFRLPIGAGSGPRTVLFHPNGEIAYLLTELSAQVLVMEWNADPGSLREIERLGLDSAEAEGARSAAAFTLSRDAATLYASNRRTGAIHPFRLAAAGRTLEPLPAVPAHGEKPWAAAISPSGKWLLIANQGSNAVVSLEMAADGSLAGDVSGSVSIAMPTCIAFV